LQRRLLRQQRVVVREVRAPVVSLLLHVRHPQPDAH
jgi:hypothetical protein